MGGWEGPRDGLDVGAKTEILSCQEVLSSSHCNELPRARGRHDGQDNTLTSACPSSSEPRYRKRDSECRVMAV
jgi:hypothetical protein